MTNILFRAGRHACLLEYIKEQLGEDGLIIGADMQLPAPALSVVDVKERVPAVYDSSYIDCIIEIYRRHNVRAAIDLDDLELPVFATSRKRFETEDVTFLVSRQEVFDVCFDKE